MPGWKIGVIALAGVMLLCCGGAGAAGAWVWSGSQRDTVGEVDFVNRLAIPRLAASRVDGQGRRVFDLTAAPGRHDFGGRTASTWGFNGAYLGPTLRASRGEKVLVNVRNGLDEATTVHWHGMHLPAAMDGGPHQAIAAGARWSSTWRVDQPAATLWYHPHPHGGTADHVYRGLAGMFIVDDGIDHGLPDRYGVDDIPIVVQDRSFDGDELDDSRPFLTDIGILGDEIVVNGTRAPYLDVSTELVRLRLLNGSNARSYNFGFADYRDFALIGTDGGLLYRPGAVSRIPLTPGERAEIVVRIRPGERAVLRSYPPELHGGALADRFNGGADRFDVLQLRAGAALSPSAALPSTLAAVELPDPAAAAKTRTFKLSGTRINGQDMDPSRVDATVVRGTTEIWEVTNADGAPHNFHVHDVQFRVLGSAVPPHLSGRKDTIFVRPNTTVRLALRFDGVADANLPYMFHCHLLAHEDNGMMGQFLVVEPGQRAGKPPHHDHGN
jgi:FtsP/CotA-like multicopper oxidase with cupredoxin domain